MHSIRLKIDDEIYDNLIRYLRKFSRDELEIIIEDTDLKEDKKCLEKELEELSDENTRFYTLNEVEERLEKIIKRHENKIKCRNTTSCKIQSGVSY